MIEILLYKRDGLNVGYRASGHARFAEHGYDVVCAAISVLTINTENSIELLTDDQYSAEMDEDGFVQLMMTGNVSHDSQVLLSAFEIGVNAISEEYGKDYIQLRIEEV
jgi:uncharacterized protein YsxB (DUF464 family)